MSCIADPVLSSIARQIGFAARLEVNVAALTYEMEKLKALKDDVFDRVAVDETQLMERKKKVEDWLNVVEANEREVSEIGARCQQRSKGLRACYPDFYWSTYKLGKKAIKKRVEIAKLMSQGNKFDDIGVEQVMARLHYYLKKDEVGIIGLYGIGGIGKTTFLKILNHDLVGTQDFDFMIWVGVDRDIGEIQKAIFESLGMPWFEDVRPNKRAGKLLKVLCKVKYLLLLDNIRQKLDLNEVGVPDPSIQNKSKVFFTTRNESMCDYMGAHRKIKIEVQGEMDAWRLFQKNTGELVLGLPEILPLAQNMAKMCEGLPLALITVGRAMADKKTLAEWRNQVSKLRRSTQYGTGMALVYSLLKFSYDCLPDDATKSCFLYCSFFPENCNINVEQVIRYWIGEGFFNRFDSYVEAYHKGYDVIRRLKIACLLESGLDEETEVKMHDVVREMALRILGEGSEFGESRKILLQSLSKESDGVEKWKEAERGFLMSKGIRDLPESPVSPNLSTLMLQWNLRLANISDTFFNQMYAIRVLDLSYTGISSLPQSLSLLENLRYLNLSFTEIRELPTEIDTLIKLRHLDLSHTFLESLPQALRGLSSLQYLDLQYTSHLEIIPQTTISTLSGLEELNMFSSFANWELGDGTGVKLEEVESLEHLTTMGITIQNDRILQGFFQSSFLLKRAKHLEIKNCEDFSQLPPSSLAEMDVLQKLEIFSCSRLNKFVIGSELEENFLSCLEELHLVELPNLSSIWEGTMSSRCLPKLRFLRINGCHKLKILGWIHNLPCLEKIELLHCDEIEEILRDDEVVEDTSIFPKLQELDLEDLPKLTSLYHRASVLPSLETLTVIRCPRLKRLLPGGHGARNLRRIEGERTWWEALEWEDEQTMKALLPAFSPFF